LTYRDSNLRAPVCSYPRQLVDRDHLHKHQQDDPPVGLYLEGIVCHCIHLLRLRYRLDQHSWRR
jgi:hypothetical protein